MIKIKKKPDRKNRMILNQIEKIDRLQKTVSELEISCEEKDKIIKSINYLRDDLFAVVNELKKQSDEYDILISDLMQMKKVMNQTVFKGRWKLIRLLLK